MTFRPTKFPGVARPARRRLNLAGFILLILWFGGALFLMVWGLTHFNVTATAILMAVGAIVFVPPLLFAWRADRHSN